MSKLIIPEPTVDADSSLTQSFSDVVDANDINSVIAAIADIVNGGLTDYNLALDSDLNNYSSESSYSVPAECITVSVGTIAAGATSTIHGDLGCLGATARLTGTAYTKGTIKTIGVSNCDIVICSVAGTTSGTASASLSCAVGDSLVDNTVTWLGLGNACMRLSHVNKAMSAKVIGVSIKCTSFTGALIFVATGASADTPYTMKTFSSITSDPGAGLFIDDIGDIGNAYSYGDVLLCVDSGTVTEVTLFFRGTFFTGVITI